MKIVGQRLRALRESVKMSQAKIGTLFECKEPMKWADRMGLLECAGSASVWRGYDSYKEKKDISVGEIDPGIFSAIVSGSLENTYTGHHIQPQRWCRNHHTERHRSRSC